MIIGLVYNLGRQCCCALTGKNRSATMSRSTPRRVSKNDSVCEGLTNSFFTIKQEEPYKDRQGNWKQVWSHDVEGNGQKVCAITGKLFEETKEHRWQVVRTQRMQKTMKDREVLTPTRKMKQINPTNDEIRQCE